MFHLLILAIIETLYIDIQIFVYLNDGKTIIFGKASFYHSFHCKIVDSMPKTIVPGMMVPLDNGYYLAALLKYRNDLFRIADTKFLVNPGESIQQFVDKDHDRQIVFLQFLLQPVSLANGDKRLGPIEITGIIIRTILVAVTVKHDKLNLVPYEGIIRFSFRTPVIARMCEKFRF